MSGKKVVRKFIKENLFIKNRLIILNEETFEEIFSFKLNLMNVFVSVTLSAIFLISVTTVIIAFTPLREFIPGYSSSKLKKDATILALKSDSLSFALKKNEAYIQSIQKILTGKLEYAKFNKDSILVENNEAPAEVDLKASKNELELREQVAAEEKKTAKAKATKKKTR